MPAGTRDAHPYKMYDMMQSQRAGRRPRRAVRSSRQRESVSHPGRAFLLTVVESFAARSDETCR